MLQCSFCTCRGSGNQQPFPLVRVFPYYACVSEQEPETLIKGIQTGIHKAVCPKKSWHPLPVRTVTHRPINLHSYCDGAKNWSHHESLLIYGIFVGFALISNLNGLAVPRSQESQETKEKKNLVKTPPGRMHGPINQVKLPSQSGPRPLSKLISFAGNRTAPKIPSFRTKHSSPQGGSMNEKAGI